MNNKPDSRALDSKTWIRESFFKLLTEQSFESITIKKLTEKAGVSRQTFYAHYTQKEDILNEYLDTFFLEISQSISPSSTFEGIPPLLIDYLKSQEAILRILFTCNLDSLLIRKLESFLTVFLSQVQSSKSQLSAIRDHDLITFIASGCFFAGKKIATSKESIDLDYYLKVLVSIIHTVMVA